MLINFFIYIFIAIGKFAFIEKNLAGEVWLMKWEKNQSRPRERKEYLLRVK